jgi:hypothetical protein
MTGRRALAFVDVASAAVGDGNGTGVGGAMAAGGDGSDLLLALFTTFSVIGLGYVLRRCGAKL